MEHGHMSRCSHHDGERYNLLTEASLFFRRVDYIPPNMPWEMSEVLVELLRQAHYLLKPGGRLVST